jgi:hypothetical protein
MVVFGRKVGAPALLCNRGKTCVRCGGVVGPDDAGGVDLLGLYERV